VTATVTATPTLTRTPARTATASTTARPTLTAAATPTTVAPATPTGGVTGSRTPPRPKLGLRRRGGEPCRGSGSACRVRRGDVLDGEVWLDKSALTGPVGVLELVLRVEGPLNSRQALTREYLVEPRWGGESARFSLPIQSVLVGPGSYNVSALVRNRVSGGTRRSRSRYVLLARVGALRRR
jgi:hypothetical protein